MLPAGAAVETFNPRDPSPGNGLQQYGEFWSVVKGEGPKCADGFVEQGPRYSPSPAPPWCLWGPSNPAGIEGGLACADRKLFSPKDPGRNRKGRGESDEKLQTPRCCGWVSPRWWPRQIPMDQH